MNAQIEHQDFAVLALYLVPRFVVCEARAIAYRWNGHGSPPTFEKWTWGETFEANWGVWFLLSHFPISKHPALTLSKHGVKCDKLRLLDGAEEFPKARCRLEKRYWFEQLNDEGK